MENVEEFCVEDIIEEKKNRPVVRSAVDLQRIKLEKMMQNPEKPVIIPELSKEKDFMPAVPSFVRNVMGSSAGAGSGEFHVYRHLRRKEYARQKFIQARSIREKLDDEYHNILLENKKKSDDKTAKKRAKRLKKKENQNKKKKYSIANKNNSTQINNRESSTDSENEIEKDDNDEKNDSKIQINEENEHIQSNANQLKEEIIKEKNIEICSKTINEKVEDNHVPPGRKNEDEK